MLTALVTVVHVIVAVFLIMVVLLQTGKRADLAGAFGGGGSQTAFGTRGAATLLSKLTTAAAVGFMLTSMSLAILASRSPDGGGSVLPDDQPPAQTESAPLPQIPAEPGTDAGSETLPVEEGTFEDPAPAESESSGEEQDTEEP